MIFNYTCLITLGTSLAPKDFPSQMINMHINVENFKARALRVA